MDSAQKARPGVEAQLALPAASARFQIVSAQRKFSGGPRWSLQGGRPRAPSGTSGITVAFGPIGPLPSEPTQLEGRNGGLGDQ